jgi:hypothetical protein
MPTNTAAELLIRIGADPTNAETSIARFRASFTRDLAGIGSDLNRWSVQGLGDFSRVRGAVLNLSGTLNRHREVAQGWKTELVTSFVEVLNTSQALSSGLVRSFLIFDSALGVNIANAVIWQKSIGEAFRKAALQAVTSIAQESLVRAIHATALGFYLLAIRDYGGAALAFKSAALYGAVGGAAALAGRALAAPEVREGERGAVARRPGEVAPELIFSGPGAQAAAAQRTVQVIFQGPVYGGQAGIDELVRHISSAVTERDVNLVAYTVVRQPTTRA